MKIDWRTLQGIIPDLAERGIGGRRKGNFATDIIGKFYCEPLSMVGLCPEVCTECAAHLDNMTKAIDPQRWYGHLVWRAKDERAAVKDLHAGHEAREVSDTGNIFADFADRLAQ